jgi:hypothetical protein
MKSAFYDFINLERGTLERRTIFLHPLKQMSNLLNFLYDL